MLGAWHCLGPLPCLLFIVNSGMGLCGKRHDLPSVGSVPGMVLCVQEQSPFCGDHPGVSMGISESIVTGSKSLAFRAPKFSFCAALWGLRSPLRPLLAGAGSVTREGTRLLEVGRRVQACLVELMVSLGFSSCRKRFPAATVKASGVSDIQKIQFTS